MLAVDEVSVREYYLAGPIFESLLEYVAMKRILSALVICFFLVGVCEAKPRRQYYASSPTTYSYMSSHSSGGVDNSSAQGVANAMAARNYVGHFGGNSGYEGCGSGSTPEQAYRNCCFANSGMATVDVGYAQGRNGQWFCCRRYR